MLRNRNAHLFTAGFVFTLMMSGFADSGRLWDADYFMQSVRRDSTVSEAQSVARIVHPKLGEYAFCTGFFVSSAGKNTLFATATHCAPDGGFSSVCSETKGTDPSVFRIILPSGVSAHCNSIVLQDSDFTLLALKPLQGIRPLRIGDFSLGLDRPLQLIGYPRDLADGVAPKTSEQCMTLSGPFSRPGAGAPAELRVGGFQWIDHDCTAALGNSGGPFILKNSDIVVGTLQSTYMPPEHFLDGNATGYEDTNEVEPADGGNERFLSIRSIVRRNRPLLARWGVTVTQLDPATTEDI